MPEIVYNLWQNEWQNIANALPIAQKKGGWGLPPYGNKMHFTKHKIKPIINQRFNRFKTLFTIFSGGAKTFSGFKIASFLI